MNALWEVLDSIYAQRDEVEGHLSNLEYEEFALENKFVKEDEEAALQDQKRQQKWLDNVQKEIDELEKEMKALEENEFGDVEAANVEAHKAIKQLLEPLYNDRGGLTKQIEGFIAEQEKQQKEKEKKEQARKDKAIADEKAA